MIFHDFSTYLKKVVCFFKTFFGKVEKNSSKWIKISENSWNKRIMKTEVYEKKKYYKLSQKKVTASKKKFGQKNIKHFFLWNGSKKFRKRLNNEKIC